MQRKERNMNRKQLMQRTAAAALAAALIGAAGAVPAAETGDQVNPEFKKLDTNRDGYIGREEARKIRGFDKAFSEADDNRDGKLDAAEFTKAQSIRDRLAAGQYVEDSVITAKIKAALLKDPVVSALAVSVETRQGTVLLSGFVDSENQQRRAQEIAASVHGVITVKNGLEVKS
jgi:hyperosmotically inducible periplasmic protein